jgi:hypothetical protein
LGAAPQGDELGRGVVCCVQVAIGQDDVVTSLGEALGDRGADPTRRTRDERESLFHLPVVDLVAEEPARRHARLADVAVRDVSGQKLHNVTVVRHQAALTSAM